MDQKYKSLFKMEFLTPLVQIFVKKFFFLKNKNIFQKKKVKLEIDFQGF